MPYYLFSCTFIPNSRYNTMHGKTVNVFKIPPKDTQTQLVIYWQLYTLHHIYDKSLGQLDCTGVKS